MVDILSAPHNAHQWQATACVLCLLAVPILLHCVRHCLLLVTRCMRPLQKWSTNLDPTSATLSLLVASVTNVHTSCRPHFIIFLSSVSIDLPCGASVFTVLCYSFADSLTPRLSFCIMLAKKLCPPIGFPVKLTFPTSNNKTASLHGGILYRYSACKRILPMCKNTAHSNFNQLPNH